MSTDPTISGSEGNLNAKQASMGSGNELVFKGTLQVQGS